MITPSLTSTFRRSLFALAAPSKAVCVVAAWTLLAAAQTQVALASPLTLSTAITENTISLKVPTDSGQYYMIQCRTNLATGDWAPFQTFEGDGSVQTATDSITNSTSRYYRAVTQILDPLLAAAPVPLIIYDSFIDLAYTGLPDTMTDAFIRGRAQHFKTNGSFASDYIKVIQLDDGWPTNALAPNGDLIPDPVRFPNMTNLVDYLHGLGYKASIYTSLSTLTCVGLPGSPDNLIHQHIQQFANYGFDMVFVDSCRSPPGYGTLEWQKNGLGLMFNAVMDSGRTMAIFFAQLGPQNAWQCGFEENMMIPASRTQELFPLGVSNVVREASLWLESAPFMRPGHYFAAILDNAQGYVSVGYRSIAEVQQQMTFAALLSLSIFAGTPYEATDIGHPTNLWAALTNAEVNAVLKDAAVRPPWIAQSSATSSVWVKRLGALSQGKAAVAFANWGTSISTNTIGLASLGTSFSTNTQVLVRDLWNRTNVGTFVSTWSPSCPPESIQFFLLTAQ